MPIPDDIERVALLGWHIVPSSRTSRAALVKNAAGQASCDLDQIELWARKFPTCNWRVILGPSGLWGLDVDAAETHAADGIANLAALAKIRGPIPPRPTVRTGGGGLALFFKHNGERIIGASGNPAAGIDPRRGAQSQTIPPSIHHKTGRPYTWLVPPWEVAPPPAPSWLLKLLEPPPDPELDRIPVASSNMARNRLYKAAYAVIAAGEGSRNDTLNRRAFQIGRIVAAGFLSEKEAAETLFGAGLSAGLDRAEVTATIRSGFRAAARCPSEMPNGGR